MRNHEGYYDPTAGLAIRHVMGHEKKKRKRPGRLTYLLGELYSFRRAAAMMKGVKALWRMKNLRHG